MQLWHRLFSAFLSAVTAVAALFGATYTDAFVPGTFPEIGIEAQAEDSVRIMSFNIRCADVNGTEAYKRRLIALEEILRIAPDSLGVQEATPEWMLWLRALPQYGVVGEGREGGFRGEHCPVLYNREKYRLVDSDTFWLSETPDEVSYGWDAECLRVCTWAMLENRKTGARYVHVNSHFDYTEGVAVRESANMITALIAERFADVPVVFTADMNTTAGSEAYRIMTASLTDTRTAAPDSVSFGTFHGAHPETHAGYIIDYVLCSPDITPLVYRTITEGVNGRFVSDHFPIYADLRFPAAAAGKRPV